jgi:hypothetical protein
MVPILFGNMDTVDAGHSRASLCLQNGAAWDEYTPYRVVARVGVQIVGVIVSV